MKISINKKDLKNDAFKNPEELPRIVREVADKIAQGKTSGICLDINGNSVGKWSL